MAGFKQIVGRKVLGLDEAALRARATAADATLLDIGTGEGTFVLASARESPHCFHIGLDAAAENMARASRTAAAKKTRLDNAVFLRGAAESLPSCLAAIADRVTVHYPWGSLMRIVAAPDVGLLARIRACCKPAAGLSVLLNYSVFEDREYLRRLGLEDVADPAANEALPADYEAAGFTIVERDLIDDDPSVRTSWGRHLVRGSARRTLVIEAVAGGAEQ